MTTCTKTLPTALVAVALALALAPAALSRAQSTIKPEPLSDHSKAAIEEALQDELRGERFYARVLKDHGDVRPFSNVVRAERRHAPSSRICWRPADSPSPSSRARLPRTRA